MKSSFLAALRMPPSVVMMAYWLLCTQHNIADSSHHRQFAERRTLSAIAKFTDFAPVDDISMLSAAVKHIGT
jgi:hypothetical protein